MPRLRPQLADDALELEHPVVLAAYDLHPDTLVEANRSGHVLGVDTQAHSPQPSRMQLAERRAEER